MVDFNKTQTFQSLNPQQKSIYSTGRSLKKINQLFNVAKSNSFEFMVQTQNPSTIQKLIIKEILNK